MDTEDPGLRDGLVGPCALVAVRPVGGEDEQGNPRGRGLHHRRQAVRHGSAGGHDHRHHPSGPACHAEGEEGRRTFVRAHVQTQVTGPVRLGECEGQRRGAGARADDGLTDPCPDEFIDQYRGDGRRGGEDSPVCTGSFVSHPHDATRRRMRRGLPGQVSVPVPPPVREHRIGRREP